MADQKNNISQELLEIIKRDGATTLGITGSPSTTLEINIDISEVSKAQRALGQMVHVVVEEDGCPVLVIGQIISIETQNRWHEDPSFKGVIKRHGKLPHLSGTADNRVATISVQACYTLKDATPSAYILGTSPSTGEKVGKMTNEVMASLMKPHEKKITYMGKVYGTDVDLPFWFKHFGKNDEVNEELGAGDAYHIGVFGKTGSGKTVTACFALLGYAKNHHNMNILVLDPQGQFFNDTELIPEGKKLEECVQKMGMKYKKVRILEDLFLPKDAYQLFSSLLEKAGFISKGFNILSDRATFAAEAIALYLENLNKASKGAQGNLNRLNDEESKRLMVNTLSKFTETSNPTPKKTEYNQYIDMVYSQNARKDQLIEKLKTVIGNETYLNELFSRYWKPITRLFMETKENGEKKQSVHSIIELAANENKKGNFVVLDLSEKGGRVVNENLQAMFVKIIEAKIKEIGERFYEENKKVNCLIVMDEAHRFIARESSDPQIAELTSEIIDSVRTTRKYGIGYMFITQTIESLDREIIQQMRIFAFGYGLTTGPELRKISELVNNEQAIALYRSFIDPSSNNRYPFMFFGPISPLSFTGSPLFLEVYGKIANFR